MLRNVGEYSISHRIRRYTVFPTV